MIISQKDIIKKCPPSSGRLGNPVEFGELICGYPMPLPNSDLAGIYQRRHTKNGIILVREKFFYTPQTQTEKMIATNTRFRNASLAWNMLSDNDKKYWSIKKRPARMTGRNHFISVYIKYLQH